MPNWLLPESLSDILPAEARKIEELRRALLDLCRGYGYELVQPPMLEHVESLLTGVAHDLDLRTFKVVDQMSGRLLGVRADITPQVARIDAHLLNRRGVVRLCYTGSVLHTRAEGLGGSREPLQLGAELYGHAGLEADLEIQELALAVLSLAGVTQVRLDLSHVGVFSALVEADTTGCLARGASELLAAVLRKDVPKLKVLSEGLPEDLRAALVALPMLYGRVDDVVRRARDVLPCLPKIEAALAELDGLAQSTLYRQYPGCQLSLDLGDVRGWQYHSGVVFSIYTPNSPNSVARGGRYDAIGASFGRARAATGFSVELRTLAALQEDPTPSGAIVAPWSDDPALRTQIQALRQQGEIVISALPGDDQEHEEFAADRRLVLTDDGWQVQRFSEF